MIFTRHTFCDECIKTWIKENNQCPICKSKIIKKQISKDLIASNIINDMQVTCNNEGKFNLELFFITECPWKGTLSELNRHLKICPFDDKRILENVKKQLSKNSSSEIINSLYDDENNTGEYLNFNPKNASLKARLFQKNPELIGKVLNEEENGNGNSDIFSIIGVDKKHIPNNFTETDNTSKLINSDISLEKSKNNIEDENLQSDINFILSDEKITEKENPSDSNNITLNNTSNFQGKKRCINISPKKQMENRRNNFSTSNMKNDDEQGDIDEEDKRNLEYALDLSLNEFDES